MTNQDMNNFSMLDLFCMETQNQAGILTNNLLALANHPDPPTVLESLQQAAHVIKSVARVVQLEPAIRIAEALEGCFNAAKQEETTFSADYIDLLLQAVDFLISLTQVSEVEMATWLLAHDSQIQSLCEAIATIPTAIVEETPAMSLSVPAIANFSDLSMLHLFRLEAESQVAILNEGLLALETSPNTKAALESLMRAAHSIKGAARIVGLDSAVKVAHILEDCFVAAQQGTITFTPDNIDILLQGVDLFARLAQTSETQLEDWLTTQQSEINYLVAAISNLISGQQLEVIAPPVTISPANLPSPAPETLLPNSAKYLDRVVRVSGENLNRLMGLAGESLVEANWLQPFTDSLMKLRHKQSELSNLLDKLQESLTEISVNQSPLDHLSTARQRANECRHLLSDRLNELELFSRRSANLSERLYREVIASHMRPFADGVQGFPRMVRDLSRQLGKQVKLEIIGKSTQVDRDILEKLEAPLTHILRNAIDHGIESPEERLAVGKPAEGLVRIEASHRAGTLSITITDDGRGIDLGQLRQKIVDRNMVNANMATQLTESELLEFLFLPGFSTAKNLTEVSGRGVGLDVAQSMVQEVGGSIRASFQPHKGMSFHLQLPLTLSVIRTLLVEIAGEPYAFPLTRIERIFMVPKSAIAVVENRQYFTLDGENVGLVAAHQVLELPEPPPNLEELPVIIISDRFSRYGLVVDKFLGERKLVVRPLDIRLGKVQDISATALMEDGSPVLIIDAEDLVRSIDNLLATGQLNKVSRATMASTIVKKRKRILVVDDSITVREMERKLLENKGYLVEIAVNGMDGWNVIRTGHYDLVISDIDMPRMNGIELVSQIKNNHNLKNIPVIIVSYKDREEDRIRGLEAGANYYLTKSSFHDDTFLNAVRDLIGEAV